MKPTKNRVMCPDCRRPKMLFETERKANDFIKWNADDLEYGSATLRAYYCPACCGWHISHHQHKESYDNQTDRLIDAFDRIRAKNNTKIDKLIRKDCYTKEIETLDKKARKVFADIPDEVKMSSKARMRDFLTSYFEANKIIDKAGSLRGAVYKLWKKDMYERYNQTVKNNEETV